MTFKEIQELIKLIAKTELSEFKIKNGEFQLHIRGKGYPVPVREGGVPIVSAPVAPAAAYASPAAAPPPTSAAPTNGAPATQPAAPAEDTSKYVEVKSPMIGTFYRSSSPDKPPYVKVGDQIKVGDTVCIVEAMKLFNEIEAEVSGKIVKVVVEDAQPVEYDQVLFLVDPAG
ncbi:MAG: acetyl-CoA carboxylase biotin carboxyl carrier protein [Bacteroidota bacterium]